MKKLCGSALATLVGGFSTVCFIVLYVFGIFKRKHISNITSYLAIAWQSIKVLRINFKKFIKSL